MDISNDTNDDAKVKVSGGGSGVTPRKGITLSVPAGTTIHHEPAPPGPWTIAFFVRDQQAHGVVRSVSGRALLTRAGNNGYRVETA